MPETSPLPAPQPARSQRSSIPAPPAVLALTTEADQARAEELARRVLDHRLAACVALRPVQSLYHWQGAIETAEEVQILFKTDRAHLAALEALVLACHSYACPQWLSWSASASPAYGAWLVGELSPGAGPPTP
jgi:periplasmic divalent cation tolerance protein